MSTHIDAKQGDIAEVVLLPGDPARLRGQWLAGGIAGGSVEQNHRRGLVRKSGEAEEWKKPTNQKTGEIAELLHMQKCGIMCAGNNKS